MSTSCGVEFHNNNISAKFIILKAVAMTERVVFTPILPSRLSLVIKLLS